MNNSKKITNKVENDNNSKVLLKKKYENFGSEEILNEKGQIIGKIIIPFLKLDKIFKIQDLNTQEIIVIEIRDKNFTKICYLKDSRDNVIANIRKKRFLSYNSKIWLKNSLKRKEYYAMGDFKNYRYKIVNINDIIVGEVYDLEKSGDLQKKIQTDIANYYPLRIIGLENKNFLIIAFTICLNILNHPSFDVSDLAGFERRIARLRPFGPGRNLN